MYMDITLFIIKFHKEIKSMIYLIWEDNNLSLDDNAQLYNIEFEPEVFEYMKALGKHTFGWCALVDAQQTYIGSASNSSHIVLIFKPHPEWSEAQCFPLMYQVPQQQ